MIECVLSPEELADLARQAARRAEARPHVRWRFATPFAAPLVAAAIISLSLYSAFVVGQASNDLGQRHAEMARYIDELGTLKAQGDDAASRFRAARLYANLNLKQQTDTEFLAALQAQHVTQDEVARFRELSAEANKTHWFERVVAWVWIRASDPKCGPISVATACLSYARLELKAGRWTEAYKSFLRYLTLINERPAGAEQYDETLTVAANGTEGTTS
jgi:hypothetical protein